MFLFRKKNVPKNTETQISTNVCKEMENRHEIMSKLYKDKLIEMYHKAKENALKIGKLYFSIELDLDYFDLKDLPCVEDISKKDGLKCILHRKNFSDQRYIVFCLPYLFNWKTGFSSKVSLYEVEYNSLKIKLQNHLTTAYDVD
jgi:hypothetical protein